MFIIVYIYREFSSRTQKKITPTQSVNSRPKLQFDLISYYINLKNGLTPLPHHPECMRTMKSLWKGQCIFLIVIKL